jgi:hypothetical protein
MNQFNQSGRVWITNELASLANNLPIGVLSLRIRHNIFNLVRDAFVSLHKNVQILATFNETDLPPKHCIKAAKTANEWTNRIGNKLFSQIENSTLKREMLYEITNAQDFGLEIIGYMDQNAIISLNEDEIIWPGQSSSKPLEVTLPKHLRCLSVFDDPPFIYSFAVVNGTRCEGYKNIQIDGMNVVVHFLKNLYFLGRSLASLFKAKRQ